MSRKAWWVRIEKRKACWKLHSYICNWPHFNVMWISSSEDLALCYYMHTVLLLCCWFIPQRNCLESGHGLVFVAFQRWGNHFLEGQFVWFYSYSVLAALQWYFRGQRRWLVKRKNVIYWLFKSDFQVGKFQLQVFSKMSLSRNISCCHTW